MLKRILLVLDVTPASTLAQRLALELAGRHGASVLGVVLLDPDTITPAEPLPMGGDAVKHHKDRVLLGKARVDAAALSQEFADACCNAKVACESRIITGSAFDALVDASALCDLVALGVDTAFEAADAEDVSPLVRRLLHEGARPVLAAPKQSQDSSGASTLIAYDGSIAAMRTLQLFACLQINTDREAVVVTIQSDAAEALRLSSIGAQYLQERGYKASARQIVADGDVAGEILNLAAAVHAGTLVAGAYGDRSWREWLIGSTTHRLLEASTTPLFHAV